MDHDRIERSARAVIIGAGIVGNSLAYHLARLRLARLILVDKGPMPKPRRIDRTRVELLFPVDYSKMMTELTPTRLQYKELGVFIESGGSKCPAAKREPGTRRRMVAAKAGCSCEMLSAEGVAKLVPYLDPTRYS